VYSGRSRPSLLWPVIVLLVTLYAGVGIYPYLEPFYKIFDLSSSYGYFHIARYILLFIALGLVV